MRTRGFFEIDLQSSIPPTMSEIEYVAEHKKVQNSCLSQPAQSGVSVRSQRETFIILEAVFSNWHH